MTDREDLDDEEQKLIEAAVAWWQGRRPLGWDQDTHLAYPQVNTAGPYEQDLADAVAAYLKS